MRAASETVRIGRAVLDGFLFVITCHVTETVVCIVSNATKIFALSVGLIIIPAVPRKHPMPITERAICCRLRDFRLKTKLSQAAFAGAAGVNLQAYLGVEHERNQLNYTVAQKILSFYRFLNPVWLVNGTGEILESRFFEWPEPEQINVGKRSLFSKVFAQLLCSKYEQSSRLRIVNSGIPLELFPFDASPQGRINNKDLFGSRLCEWLADLPDNGVAHFLNELFVSGVLILNRHTRDENLTAISRRKAEMREIELKRRFGGQNDETENSGLTILSLTGNNCHVKPQMPDFLKRLNKATSERGAKTTLAKFLGVPLVSVSQWLSGIKEPSGENTLRLLRWVEQRERQK